jgi:predicted metal-dependent hydrolase
MRIHSPEITTHGITVSVVRKRIKNIYLRVYQPHGRVQVSAPKSASDAEVRSVVVERVDWIKRQQARIAANPRPTKPRIATGETHYFLGQAHRLEVIDHTGRSRVLRTDDGRLELHIKSRSSFAEREKLLECWYRRQLKAIMPSLIEKWQPLLNVRVAEWGVKRMKTKWGTCNIKARRIWLNLELIKRPAECLEYVVVHEMIHLLERYHNARFYGFMDQFLPEWRQHQHELNSWPIALPVAPINQA